MAQVVVAEFLSDVDQTPGARVGIQSSFERCLVLCEVGGENVGDIQILRIHFQAACLGRNVMNVNVAAVPAAIGYGGPAIERDRKHALAGPSGGDFPCHDSVLISFQYLVLQGKTPWVHLEFAVDIRVSATLEAHIAFLSIVCETGGMS